MRKELLVLVSIVFVCAINVGQAAENELVLEPMDYRARNEVRSAWVNYLGAGEASIYDTAKGMALKLPASFADNSKRCYWDKNVDYNLSS